MQQLEIHLARTIDSDSPNVTSDSRDCCPKIELIEGSGPRLVGKTLELLQVRLRAAALVLLVAFAAFLPRRLFVEMPLLYFHVALIFLLAIVVAALYGRRWYSMTLLRALELLVFGACAAFLGMYQYQAMLWHAAQGEPVYMLTTMKSIVLYFFALENIYGMFIPNTWRRAAAVVIPIALTPALVAVLLWTLNPSFAAVAIHIANVEHVTDNVLMLLIGAGGSIFGTHVINTLRREAHEAKQFGQYKLKQLLGAGGMGKVYFAEHQLMKRPCAIKIIRPEKAGNPTALARFEREVRETAKLSHPNTIEIYDYGRTDDGTLYYVMEFLPGLSLADLVDRQGPLPAERVIYLLRQMCGALREAHGIGLIHRDIKPGNIFVAKRGGMHDVAKLLDFGLVKPRASRNDIRLTQDGSLAGSPLFMSPEQAMGEDEPDPRSDIYSLGAVAYFALTGHAPFEGTHPMEVIVAHARDRVIPPSQREPQVPEDLERTVLRCLAKLPAERYQDAASLDDELRRCQAANRWSEREAADWWKEQCNANLRSDANLQCSATAKV